MAEHPHRLPDGVLRSLFAYGLLAAMLAAATLACQRQTGSPGGDTDRVVEHGPAPRAELTAVRGEVSVGPFVSVEDELELRYSLDRDAFVTLIHGWDGVSRPIYEGKAPAAADFDGRFDWGLGVLGYHFDDEPGEHVFVLVASDSALPRRDAVEVARALPRPRIGSTSYEQPRGVGIGALVLEARTGPVP